MCRLRSSKQVRPLKKLAVRLKAEQASGRNEWIGSKYFYPLKSSPRHRDSGGHSKKQRTKYRYYRNGQTLLNTASVAPNVFVPRYTVSTIRTIGMH